MIPQLPSRLAGVLPPICHVHPPRSGLGNMLIVWARARVFAELNGLPLVATGWLRPRIGPWLRREDRKRFYGTTFRQPRMVDVAHARTLSALGHCVHEPPVARVIGGAERGKVYFFEKLPHSLAYFDDLRAHRELLRRELPTLLTGSVLTALASADAPTIGVHVRRGDFMELKAGQDISRNMARAPLSYFARMIATIREVHGSELPATIFSDGYDHELAELLELPGVSRAPRRADVVDLLALSRSKVIVASPWSTFSLFAAFLSDAAVIQFPTDSTTAIRADDVRARSYEGVPPGTVAEWPRLLLEAIRSI